MSTAYPVDPGRLATLKATRAGRIALDGFEYQRAFAVLRLAALALRRPVLGAVEIPTWIRYDWGEDIDEVATDGSVILWQCKRGDGWGQPAHIVDVLESFAPKWLWTSEADRTRLRFRLVTSDPTFAGGDYLPAPFQSALKDKVKAAFLSRMVSTPTSQSDRVQWHADAALVGHSDLFNGLWERTTVLYVPGHIVFHDGAPMRYAEDHAVYELFKGRKVVSIGDASRIVGDLRALLSIVPPKQADANGMVPRPDAAPSALIQGDVDARLFQYVVPGSERDLFVVVDRTFLERCLHAPKPPPFVARRPEWTDVVRGQSSELRFLERSMTTHVQRTVARALESAATGGRRLQVQFLTGAPGAGKSTLAIRVAAILVQGRVCVVADARFQLSVDEEIDSLVGRVRRLAATGLGVLLLLDDPLSGDSAWPRALSILSRGAPNVVVLAATPDFLLDRHRSELRGVDILEPISADELTADDRAGFAVLYPEVDSATIAQSNEELLVLSMEAAAGQRFDAVIDGIWATLADGQSLAADTLGDDLPWCVVALTVVSFFHRAYVPCPEQLLSAVLRGRADVGLRVAERLRDLRLKQGWRIFRMEAATRWSFQGASVLTMHARVAQRAWERRPSPAWDVAAAIAEASVTVPTVAWPLGLGIRALHEREAPEAGAILDSIVATWTSSATGDRVETRHLADLCAVLPLSEKHVSRALGRVLAERAGRVDAQSWIAMLQLHIQSSPDPSRRSSLVATDVQVLLEAADFSLAPKRALKFLATLAKAPEVRQLVESRLWAAFDYDNIGAHLLCWLIANGSNESVISRGDAIRTWLREHPDDGYVHSAFLATLIRFPASIRDDDVSWSVAWVRAHPANQNVCTTLLSVLVVRRSTQLGPLLSDTLATIGFGTSSASLGGAALRASATLGFEYLTLITEWIGWASSVLRSNEGNRAAMQIAVSLPFPCRTMRALLSSPEVSGAERTRLTEVLRATHLGRTRWLAALGPRRGRSRR